MVEDLLSIYFVLKLMESVTVFEYAVVDFEASNAKFVQVREQVLIQDVLNLLCLLVVARSQVHNYLIGLHLVSVTLNQVVLVDCECLLE